MADDVLASIRAVTDRAMGEIAPGSKLVARPLAPRERSLLEALAGRVDPGGVDLSGVRLRNLRRALLKLIRPSTESQKAFNADVHRALSEAMARIQAERSSVDAVRAGLASLEVLSDVGASRIGELEESVDSKVDVGSVHSLETRLLDVADELRGEIVHQADRLGGLTAAVDSLAAEVKRSQGELSRHRAVVDLALRELRSSVSTGDEHIAAVTRPLDESFDKFYEDFESVFRGSRELVMERQRHYLEMVADLPGPLLDIGPGRGEWLELLSEAGISATGVDSNGQFATSCQNRGLEVVHGDAFDHLRSVPEASLGGITAFHVLEHLSFENLVDLLGLCLVALRPGGLLVLETPNPANLNVGSMSFWNNPSHVRPLPPHMMEFLVRWRGFTETKVHFPAADHQRALSIEGVSSKELDDINLAMFGPSDYAIIARRP